MEKPNKGQYNPKHLEAAVRKRWEAGKIPQKLARLDGKRKKFYLLDGPPYANADPHVGHVKTTALKDIWSKFKLMQGFSSWFQPGFDMHGLPIENAVEKKLGIKSKHDIEKMGVAKFIMECRNFATGNEQKWLEMYRRLGAWRGYFDPYITFQNYYIESGWWTVKKMSEKGMLAPGEKSIYWCPHCETALAGYEVSDSYADVRDPSIYVKFPLEGRENEFIIIMTTTPWTLVSNVAIAVHPEENYVKARAGKETFIIAESRAGPVLNEMLGIEYKIVEKMKGSDLQGKRYMPVLDIPLQQELHRRSDAHRIVLSIPVLVKKSYKHGLAESGELVKEFVTMEGTGAVHTAPGHGPEDHIVGVHYNLPVVSPVNEQGRYTAETGEFQGLFVKDADKIIADKLEKEGLLLKFSWIVHSYPLCWRCKSPLIFRVSKQWFFSVDKIKGKMLSENRKVRWLPDFGMERLHNWLEDATDWCISQQRYWGIPLPVWVCGKCGKFEVVGSLAELRKKSLKKLPKGADLHKHVVDKIKIKCKCNGIMKRVPDTMNVWFDSGIAPWASLGYPYRNKKLFEKLWPADLVDESQDQIRGWFYSLMFCGVAAFGRAPYKCVALNGWVLDEKGEKMSKSLGNVVAATEALDRLGADILRLYYCWEVAPWEVQNFSFRTAEEIRKAMNILWNSYSFYLTYARKSRPSVKSLKTEDMWVLSRLNTLIDDVTSHMENFEFHHAGRKIVSFVVEDLSRVYIKLIRDRVWITQSGKDKASALSVLRECLFTVAKLLAPITPFLSEEIFEGLGQKSSVFLSKWPKANRKLTDRKLEESMALVQKIIESANSTRHEAKIKARWPLRTLTIEGSQLKQFDGILRFMTNVKEVKYGKVKGNFKDIGFAKICLDTNLSSELKEEALFREVVRKVQDMRKRRGMIVTDRITLVIGNAEEMRKWEKELMKEVGAAKIIFGNANGEKLDFEGKAVGIEIRK